MTDAKRAATEMVLGVDTHLDVHVVVALDHLGRRLGELSVPTMAKGYESLVCWAEGFGAVRCAGVEGTSSYEPGIVRHLKTAAIPVTEVERPKRRHLHRNSKPDSRDAESAARAVLAGETAGEPKSATRPCGDDPSLEDRPPLRGEIQNAGRQPAPVPTGDGARRAAPPFAWTLD